VVVAKVEKWGLDAEVLGFDDAGEIFVLGDFDFVGEIAFGKLGIGLVEKFRDRAVEDTIAEEF
jgi:hypothetical protein